MTFHCLILICTQPHHKLCKTSIRLNLFQLSVLVCKIFEQIKFKNEDEQGFEHYGKAVAEWSVCGCGDPSAPDLGPTSKY